MRNKTVLCVWIAGNVEVWLFGPDLRSIQRLPVQLDGLYASRGPFDLHGQKMLGAGNLPGDCLRRLVDVIEGSAAPSRDEVVHSIGEIVLIVVVVTEETGA